MLTWEKTWGWNNSDETEALGVASSKRGDIYVAGYTAQIKVRSDAFLLKFSPDGSLAWQRTWRWNDFADAWGVAVAQDGGIYVTGTNLLPNERSAAYVVKFSADGRLVWQRAWGLDRLTGGHGVAAVDDGSVYVTGVTGNEAYEAFLLKFSPDGELMWQRTWASEDGGIGNGGGRSAAVASDGSIYVAGGSAFLAKFAPDGGLVWHRRWRAGDWNDAHSVAVSSDGSIYTTGFVDQKVLLLKFLANGTLAWLREWTSGNNDIAYGVAVSKYDETYVAGGTGPISIPLLLKFLADGSLAWQNALQGYNSRAWAVASGEDSVYFVGGVLSEGSIGQLQALSGKVKQPANVFLSSSLDILNTPSGSAGSPFGTLNMTNNSPIFSREGAFLLKISEHLSTTETTTTQTTLSTTTQATLTEALPTTPVNGLLCAIVSVLALVVIFETILTMRRSKGTPSSG
jgi:hypothetical protein